jgi:two-component system, response regulator
LPRLVLLDLKLPGLNGHEVLERLRQDARTRHVPVVMLTSSVEAEDVHRSYVLGANSYVRKPVSLSEFVEMAKQIDRYWLTLNQLPTAS